MRNEVQLITYANRFGGRTLGELHDLLKGPLKGAFGGVHLLPFFLRVDGADAGFDPIDHTLVDPIVGQWDDVKAITRDFDVMADVIVNHISTESPQFRDFVRHGAASPHASLFLTRDAIFPQGASEQELAAIYRPRPGLPFNSVTLQTGEQRSLWTTFTPQQVDIDVRHSQGRAYLEAILRKLSDSSIRMIRLDAVGYAIKRAGSSCFMIPETFEFIADLAAAARALRIEVLVEVHSYYRRQIEIAAHVDWVYDFALPPLILHAFAFKTAVHLKEWIQIRPANALTVLDTHDGIGIIDIGPDADDRIHHPGLVPPEELDRLVEIIHERTGGQSRQATGAAASNLDLYQVNSTFFDAMGRDERQYLLARAIQFFLPGIPQVYYVGLLAGRNDMDLLARTGVGRDINRHYYSRDEVERELKRPVVQELLGLIRLRNTHPAFAGRFELEATTGNTLSLKWSNGEQFVRLSVDFVDSSYDLKCSKGSESRLEAADRCHSI
jgi:sucrose phosphorylase